MKIERTEDFIRQLLDKIRRDSMFEDSIKVGRHEGSCCKDMLQRQKTCVVVHTEATCSTDVKRGHLAGTCSRDKITTFAHT